MKKIPTKNLLILLAITVLLIGGLYLKVGARNPSINAALRNNIIELKNGDSFTMTASYVHKKINGVDQTMLAYNGSIPGPTIRVKQGSEITIHLKNNTDIPQLLHSHGIRMDNAYDGSPMVQKDILPGESFDYKLKFPDVGAYWYHPHVQEVYGQGSGLYGAFIVTPNDAAYFPLVNSESVVFLSDLPIKNGVIALHKDDKSHALMGHYGNLMLTNGQEKFNLSAKTGEVVRLYVINAANARPFNFTINGLKLKLIGSDSGSYEKATFVDSVILGPSERAIIDVLLPQAGSYKIENKTPDATYILGAIDVSEEVEQNSYSNEYEILQTNTQTIKSIDPFRKLFNIAPDQSIVLTLGMSGGMMGTGTRGGMMSGGGMMRGGMMGSANPDGIEWEDSNQMMSSMSTSDTVKWIIKDRRTGLENKDIKWVFQRGNPVKIRIFNDSHSMHPMQHPIHFHGQRFLVVARDGIPQLNLAWKDTALVKSGETVDIVLDPSNVGMWMAHCHISEHLADGMMFEFNVEK